VKVGLMGLAVEVAEATARHTHVCGVDVAIDLPGYHLGVGNLLGTQMVGTLGQAVEWYLVPQPQRLLASDALACLCSLKYLLQHHTLARIS
jgi:hypothetical protein